MPLKADVDYRELNKILKSTQAALSDNVFAIQKLRKKLTSYTRDVRINTLITLAGMSKYDAESLVHKALAKSEFESDEF